MTILKLFVLAQEYMAYLSVLKSLFMNFFKTFTFLNIYNEHKLIPEDSDQMFVVDCFCEAKIVN